MMENDEDSDDGPLRWSLFNGVPPYINFIPRTGVLQIGEALEKGAHFWDEDQNWNQDQLWRYPIAMENWIEAFAKECEKYISTGQTIKWDGSNRFISAVGMKQVEIKQPKRIQARIEIKPAFIQRPDDSKRFTDSHPGVKLVQFPRLHQISKKDTLGKNFRHMRQKYGDEAFGFHPITYILPDDKISLVKHMRRSKDLWIVKPPHNNNGSGVYVIKSPDEIPDAPVCVQQYIRNPLLIDGKKFDIRIYVLMTSMDPFKLYIYDDGLVRIATEEYTEDLDKIQDCCIHVCNYAVNSKNTEKFIVNNNPDLCEGHKWRLACLWPYLIENKNLGQDDIDYIRSQIEDVVVKTVLSSYPESRHEYLELSESTCYNGYRLVGYDMLIDNDLKVHLIEVNSKPQLSGALLDKAVNRPMLREMLKIIGYHLPPTLVKRKDLICKTFPLAGGIQENPVTYESSLYRRRPGIEDFCKQDRFFDNDQDREAYLNTILEDLTTGDLRQLVIAEEERHQLKLFKRIIPSDLSHKYLKFMDKPSYFDKLFDAFEQKYSNQREEGVKLLQFLCLKNRHL